MDVALAGMVRVVDGVSVALGPTAFPDQNMPPRLALTNFRVLSEPVLCPKSWFQVTWTFETVIE